MKYLVVALCLLVQCRPTPAQQQDFEGAWMGKLSVKEVSVDLVIRIADSSGIMTCKMDLPGQGLVDFKADTLAISGDSIRFGWNRSQTLFRGRKVNSTNITGIWSTRGEGAPVRLMRLEDGIYRRPQEPRPPLPYRSEDVTFPSAYDNNVTLAGTLTIPEGDGPFPALVLITGSGPQDRDEAVYGHRPFLVLADRLTRKGIAVLRFDDRGTAGSTGEFEGATTRDFAMDGLGAVAFLAKQEMFKPSRIGIGGHTEGGSAAMIAAHEGKLDFLVLLATAGTPNSGIVLDAKVEALRSAGLPAQAISMDSMYTANIYRQMAKWDEGRPDTIALRAISTAYFEDSEFVKMRHRTAESFFKEQVERVTEPWFSFYVTFDPSEYIARIERPILAIHGSEDAQLDADTHLKALANLVPAQNITTRKLNGLNHYFQPADDRVGNDYGMIDTTFAESAVNVIAEWILQLD